MTSIIGLLSAAILGSTGVVTPLPSPTYTHPLPPPPPLTQIVHAAEKDISEVESVLESPKEVIHSLSEEYKVNYQVALAIATSESTLDPLAKNPKSSAKGLYQFTDATWKEQCQGDVLNVKDNAKCAMSLMQKGQYWRWSASATKWTRDLPDELLPTHCSCIKGLRMRGVKIPYNTDASDLEPNATPAVGRLALFDYNGLAHVALITKIEETGFWVKESNYSACREGKRFVKWNDKSSRGFVEL